MSKLMSLVVVLAIASVVCAANNQWQGPSASEAAGNWNVASNWSLGRVPDYTASDTVICYRNSATFADTSFNIIVTDAQDGGTKTRLYYSLAGSTTPNLLTIASGGSLTTQGSVDNYNVDNTITIQAGGAWYAGAGSTGLFKIASNTSTYSNTDIVNVYGILDVRGSAQTSTINITNDSRDSGGNNTGTLNIIGGIVLADIYAIGDYGNGSINISNHGVMIVRGDVTSQAQADITAGKITGVATGDVHTIGNWTVIPEPATIALLGLGGLLLRRKR